MKRWIIKITWTIMAITIGVVASYLLVVKGIKWPAGIIGIIIGIGMLVLPRYECCCHRNNPVFWYLPHNRYHR
jgi:hypothetical protein